MKDLLVSKTVIGAFVSAFAIVAKHLGYEIGDTDGLVNDLVAVFGALFAIYGRTVAVKPIGSVAGVKIKE